MLRVIQTVDKANGYVFGDLEERNIQALMSCAVGAEFEYEKIQGIREKYMDVTEDSEEAIEKQAKELVEELESQ